MRRSRGVLRCFVSAISISLLCGCLSSPEDKPSAGPDPSPPREAGTAESRLLKAQDLPGSWQTTTVDGAAVPRLALCGEPLPPESEVRSATSRTFSSPEQTVRDDLFELASPEAALAKLRDDLSRCTSFNRSTKSGTVSVRVRPVGAMEGLVAARLTAQSSGRTVENLLLAGVRDGDFHLVTMYDDRVKGAGDLAITLQKWLRSSPD